MPSAQFSVVMSAGKLKIVFHFRLPLHDGKLTFLFTDFFIFFFIILVYSVDDGEKLLVTVLFKARVVLL